MKIQITTTQEKEIQLPYYMKTSEYESCKVVSETEVIIVHVWDCDSFKAAKIEQRKDAKGVLSSKHEEITADEFQSHLNKAKRIIDEAYNKAVVKPIGFGDRNDYEVGDVVVWNGQEPCICKLAGRANNFGASCYKSYSKTHDSLHYRLIRPATPEEIELLVDNEIYYL